MNTPNKHDELDEIKLQLAKFIIMNFSISTIREKGISNLNRWKSQDVWCSAHDEWRALLDTGSDEEIITAMTARDQHSNRLRQSPPYVGLLTQETVMKFYKLPFTGSDTF